LAREVKDAATQGKNTLHMAKAKHSEHVTQLRLKVKCVKILSKEAQEEAEKEARERFKVAVSKLERDKDALREHGKSKRACFKVALQEHEAKHAALELKSSELELAVQKMARVMASKVMAMEVLEE
jgi:hypothetical protein